MNTPPACKWCGGPAPAAERCTNGHCGACHRAHCTPGGATSPGHGVRPRTGVLRSQAAVLVGYSGGMGEFLGDDGETYFIHNPFRPTQAPVPGGRYILRYIVDSSSGLWYAEPM